MKDGRDAGVSGGSGGIAGGSLAAVGQAGKDLGRGHGGHGGQLVKKEPVDIYNSSSGGSGHQQTGKGRYSPTAGGLAVHGGLVPPLLTGPHSSPFEHHHKFDIYHGDHGARIGEHGVGGGGRLEGQNVYPGFPDQASISKIMATT